MCAKKNEKIRLPGQMPLMENATGTGKAFQDVIIQWKGLNLRDTIDTGELTYTKNICSDALPYLVPRPPRSEYKSGIVLFISCLISSRLVSGKR